MKRIEAIDTGTTIYDADKPCRAGHWPTKRYTSNGMCVSCLKHRYQHTRHPLSRRVLVPSEVAVAFEALCASLGVTIIGATTAPDALTYEGEFPGVKPI
jgi:hypothetical protein